jgi:transposase InsO family protein
MNIHKNARLTPRGRVLLVQRIESGVPVGRAAAAAGVSRQTAYRWLRRYRGGDRQLEDRSSAPHWHPHRLGPERTARIEDLRRQRLTGPMIARILGLSCSTVGLVLRRLGLNRLARLEPAVPAVRYEHERPGDLIHIDTKKLGRIEGVGHRIHGDRTRRARGPGWEHLHVAVDDCSRLAYTEMLPDQTGAACAGFLGRAAAWFTAHGVIPRRIMTDNAFAYTNSADFKATLAAIGARHITTRPYRPRTNGKAERFIQTALREWLYARAYQRSDQRTADMTPWLHWYNHHRPHSALGAQPPAHRVNNVLGNDT